MSNILKQRITKSAHDILTRRRLIDERRILICFVKTDNKTRILPIKPIITIIKNKIIRNIRNHSDG
jgi:hypothetical protein